MINVDKNVEFCTIEFTSNGFIVCVSGKDKYGIFTQVKTIHKEFSELVDLIQNLSTLPKE
jgi:hypothetical protein